MHRNLRLAALALLLVTALTTSALADGTTGPAGFPYSTTGFGPYMMAACLDAKSKVESHCPEHGTITTTPGDCIWVPDREGHPTFYFCNCTASTGWCNPFGHPGFP